MAFDPLAPYRRTPLPPEATTTRPKEPEGYVAFGGKDRVERLRIRRAMAPTRSPRYHRGGIARLCGGQVFVAVQSEMVSAKTVAHSVFA